MFLATVEKGEVLIHRLALTSLLYFNCKEPAFVRHASPIFSIPSGDSGDGQNDAEIEGLRLRHIQGDGQCPSCAGEPRKDDRRETHDS